MVMKFYLICVGWNDPFRTVSTARQGALDDNIHFLIKLQFLALLKVQVV